MKEETFSDVNDLTPIQHFPIEWVKSQPRKVEEILSGLTIEEQAKCVLSLSPHLQMQLLVLCEDAVEVTRSLPAEEIYNLIKEVGEEDSLLVLSMASSEQLQYIFDLEWWQGDKFQPHRAMDWLGLLDQCDDPETLNWFLSEDFDQKVMLFQSLVKVYKQDEMTDSYEGVEGLEHFSPDGVYDLFFKVKETKVIRKLLLLLSEKDISYVHDLLEAVIWYPVSVTLEKSYQGRLNRTAEKGIPPFEEAIGVYSSLNPESLKQQVPALDSFPGGGRFRFSPQYPLAQADLSLFFSQCVQSLGPDERLDTIRWELVCLANKVMVADKCDPTHQETRQKTMRKVLGYVNIGLELGASGDPAKGQSLLRQLWMQSLFQVGYEQLKQIRSKATLFIKENGTYIENFISPGEKEKLGALVFSFPQVNESEKGAPLLWRDMKSLDDIRTINNFLERWVFYVRLSKQSLGLNEQVLQAKLGGFDFPENGSLDLLTLVTTTFARHTLFKELSSEPLPVAAAKSFLEIIFIPGIFRDEGRICDEDKLSSFERAILDTPLAWTDLDKKLLRELLLECVANLEAHFGQLDLSRPVEWQFTQGLLITKRRTATL